jgi:putative oxidoreductase
MKNLDDIALLIFRTAIGAFMLFGHGLGKLNRLISGGEIKFADPLGIGMELTLMIAVLTEFFASILIILGIFTRISSLSLFTTMFIAGFIHHADDPFGGKEKALLYLICYFLIFFIGPGKYSLQFIFNKRVNKLKGIKKFLLS